MGVAGVRRRGSGAGEEVRGGLLTTLHRAYRGEEIGGPAAQLGAGLDRPVLLGLTLLDPGQQLALGGQFSLRLGDGRRLGTLGLPRLPGLVGARLPHVRFPHVLVPDVLFPGVIGVSHGVIALRRLGSGHGRGFHPGRGALGLSLGAGLFAHLGGDAVRTHSSVQSWSG